MSDEDKKYAYLPSSKQRVKYLDPPTGGRPYIEGFESVSDVTQESFSEKLFAYSKKNPFVIAGFGVCFYAFVNGVRAVKNRNAALSEKMMAIRAGSGVFIIAALCLGNYYHNGTFFPTAKIEEKAEQERRRANVYYMAMKRKEEAEGSGGGTATVNT
ncbi:uncharacterized protein LOC133181436 [Saccostrea echinata]|uniref:uncharacterized protein LOC133181436 n=1 Tax=Saccostrea echinata TaxID=191078 RepID=UPI002A7FE059|nr:uncharacterized protein LOC133181436 [Saccostrea echinata]